MSKRLMLILIACGLLLLLLLVAWLDGGRIEQRQIVEPVTVPENNL